MKTVIALWRHATTWRRVTLLAVTCAAAVALSRQAVTPPRMTPPSDTANAVPAASLSPVAPTTTQAPAATPALTTLRERYIERQPPGSAALTPSRSLQEVALPPPAQPKDDTPVFRGKDQQRLRPSRPAAQPPSQNANDSKHP